MKVLYLSGAVGVGGVETFLLQISQMPGIDSSFFLFQDGPLKQELEKRGARVFLARSHFRLRNPISWYFTAQEISGLCKRLGIHCIHSSMAYAALVGSQAAKKSNIPHIWFQHGPVGGWMDKLAGKLKNSGIICNSQSTLEQQRRITPDGKFFLMPLGTPRVPEKEFSNSQVLRVVMACRAQRWKGAHLFRQALEKLNDPAVQGTIFFSDPENEYAQEVSGSKSLKVLPSTYNVEELFANQDVLVNASITAEPFGLTIIEAMMRGIVPIAPSAGGPLEIINDRENGLLFQPGDAEDLAQKIRSLKDSQVRRSLSKAARLKAEEIFSLEKMFERMMEIYRQLK